ncbi:MAG: tRNA lysidine(34) synthetase TilS [Oscillospiraceae bacterium]|nr:tRNA lysidine(34) synthetase TilS [Oscillospiraceae bacterium]
MLTKIKAAITQYDMIQVGDCVTVAVSGGADSVALFHALSAMRTELGIDVIRACHVNHQLRGAESDADDVFVREFCGDVCACYAVDVQSLRRKHQSVEEAAREARYAVFDALPESFGKVATAHTATDNAETVLLNMIRGTGLKGLCGIPPVRERFVRPLILCERTEVEEYCREQGLRHVTDSTNANLDFTRNRVRLSLIPLIREINPSFDGNLAKMCETLREDSEFLDALANCDDYSVNSLRKLRKPLLTRIIIGLLADNNISPSYLRVSQICEILALGRGKINLAKHKFAIIDSGILKIKTIEQDYR